MNFTEIANSRQSCRAYNSDRQVENEGFSDYKKQTRMLLPIKK